MTLKKPIVLIFILPLLLLTSCYEVANEIKNWTEINASDQLFGKQHYLDKDGIKVFLPESFKPYNAVEYNQLIDSLVVDNKKLKIEQKRLKTMREIEGNHYIFFDSTAYSTYTINTIPYTPITRQDAKYLLGIIRQNQDNLSQLTDLKYTKLTAKHNNNGNTQVFKAIYKVENEDNYHQIFQHIYFVSSNKKTAFINLSTPFDVNFDPFLEKMIL
ncbi:hypothetical protein [Winogradskyella endarachnes]|uniref:Lipoprotein n=1 Tax=Winogradskyella endarachnes TaxID=2681965 RepID=A0A6L6U9W4_9FLAO|nr:hypothetical protein [Winogradskyella endarachnes]MUU77604.1 hypothetical protein [Winogradskyella endarachnes]